MSVGRDRSGLFQPAVDEYAGRLKHYTKLEVLELPESSGKKLPPGHAKEQEAKAILGKLQPNEALVALDEHGKTLDSVELAQFLGRALNQSKDLAFVIGGDEGLHDSVLKRAELTLSLGRMTLPHRLARVVLIEQLYRAFTILRGEPYHRT